MNILVLFNGAEHVHSASCFRKLLNARDGWPLVHRAQARGISYAWAAETAATESRQHLEESAGNIGASFEIAHIRGGLALRYGHVLCLFQIGRARLVLGDLRVDIDQ